MRYGIQTRLAQNEVLDRACAYFGPGGEVGLPLTQRELRSVTFAADIGSVTISVEPTNDGTDVTILSREFDYWAERFMRELH